MAQRGRDDRTLAYTARKSVAWWGIDLASNLDVNGDGHPDVVITHPDVEPYGEVIVMSGATGQELYTIAGDPQFRYEFRWQCVDKLGDVDSDGCDDFVVGVLDAVRGVSGAAVHSGRTGQRLTIALADQWPQETVGASVAGASDLDGDGKPDFFASSHGSARGLVIAFSSATGRPIRMWWGSTQGNSGFGFAIRSCDVDRDGVSDLVIARPRLLDVAAYSGRDGTELVTVPIGFDGIVWVETVVDPGVDGFPRLLAMQPNYGLYRWPETFGSEYRGRTQLYRSVPAGMYASGQGCTGTLGSEPRIGWRRQGQGARVHLSNVPAGSTGVLLLGLSTRQWGSVPLPLSLDPYGFPGCVLGTSVDAALSVATGTQGLDRGYGFADVPQDLAIPGAGAVRVFAQWMVLSPTGAAASSQLVEWWVRE